MKLYRYMFSRLFDWGLRTHGFDDFPEYNAIFGLSFLAYINALTISMMIECILETQILSLISSYAAVAIGFFVLFVHYLAFVYKGKALRIAKEYRDGNFSRSDRFFVWLYPIGTLALFFVLIAVRTA